MASSSILYGELAGFETPRSRPFSTTNDVFLSFRGRDSRKIIADPLCTALYFEGINTYFNDHELVEEMTRHFRPIGHLDSQLLPDVEGLSFRLPLAAKMSKISIVVLSESYASSGWCLDELVELMDMGKQQHVIPIFYHVDPADVVHQTGGFGTAFRKHTDMMKADTWKTTLTKIGRFPGYHVPNAQKWLEPELISVIVRNVSGLLCGNDAFSCDTGSDVLCHEESLETDPNRICQVTGAPNVVTGSVNMPAISLRWPATGLPNFTRKNIVLARMRGLGEARLRSIFGKNSKSRKKSRKAVVPMNTISTASQADEMEVQVDFQGSYYDLFDVEEFLRLLKKDLEYNALVSKHVLVRNLKVMDIEVSKLSEIPNNLRFPDLKKLFLYTNFRLRKIPKLFFEQRPPVYYIKLNLKYLPPSVFEQMPALKELKFSYSPMRILPPPVSDIILPPWDINLSTREEYCYLTRDFQLTRIPHIISALDNLTALDLTRCPLIEFPESFDFPRSLSSLNLTKCESLTKLPLSIGKLRFLKYIHLSGCSSLFESRCGKLPIKRLSWNKQAEEMKIQMDNHGRERPGFRDIRLKKYGRERLDFGPYLSKLVGLMKCVSEYNFLQTKFVAVRNLKVVHISNSKISEIPDSVSFPDLELLILERCESHIPYTFFKKMPALRVLDMSNASIKYLPPSVVKLMKLEKLILKGCEHLMEMPHNIGVLGTLNELDLSGCKSLVKLPESTCKLRFLKKLNLSGCGKFAEIPESFEFPPNLETLNITDCTRLTKLPESVGKLTCLQELNLSGCTNLNELPESIRFLERLNLLVLTNCKSLTKLPELLSELKYLVRLELSGCSSLFEFFGPQVSLKCLSWNIGNPDQKKVELDFHETKGTPSDITEILGLMEKILQHPFLKSKAVAVIKLKVIHMSSSKVPEIPKNLSFPDLEKLVLHPDFDFSSITSSFFKSFPAFPVLDMSHSSIKTLPSWVYELTDLKGLILQRCELLIELPDGIGALENLELLDLEGTHLVCLPDELGKLINLMCLKVSLYYDDSYMKSRKILDIIPTALLSKLTKLEELSIKFDPQDVWCNALVKAIIADLLSLRKLKTLKLYLPSIELLQNLMELKSNEDDMSIYQNLSNFSVIIGPHGQRFISRLPCDLEEEYLKLKKCLNYIAGKDNTSEFFAEALKHANALYLDRHWNIQKLSIFKADKLNKLKFCMLVDCNEMQTVFDASDFNHEDNILSLQYLAIHYLKNLEVIWKGLHVVCCLQYLKVLVLHMCPNLTTIFTPVLLGVLVNLKEITVEDCAKITSLVSGDSTQLTGTEHLLRLKKLSLLYLPELESISSGISIGPKLENVVIYDCPKLKILPSLGVHNEKVIKIKGEGEWWNALEWSDGQPQYLHNAFSELDIEGAFLDELGTQYVNSLRLFVEECNAN